MKRTPLRRKSPFGRGKGLKRGKGVRRVSGLGSLQKAADKPLTPIAKLVSPTCEACPNPTEVGHHWIEKSRSSFLRYDLRNIVSLCHSCHAKIHNRFGNSVTGALDVADIVTSKRGREWRDAMAREARTEVKVDAAFYQGHRERLEGILAALQASKVQ